MDKNVGCIWDCNCVVRKLSQSEYRDAMNFGYCSKTMKTHLELMYRDGSNVGTIVDGFLVDGKNGLENHYVTSTGIIITRNHDSGFGISVSIGKPGKIRWYYDSVHQPAPNKVIKFATDNPKIRKVR